MPAIFAGLGLNELLLLAFGIFAVIFILKKLFKLAIIIAVIAVFIHFGLPILTTVMPKM